MAYIHSLTYQMFKKAAERAELQQRALAEDIERERLHKHKPVKFKKKPAPQFTPIVTVKRRLMLKETT